MKAIVHRQAVVNRLINNTSPWIVTTPVFELLQNAVYDVRNTSMTTTEPGFIHIPPSGLTIRINEYDKNYVQHYPTLINLKRGDIINIGSASCTLTASPIYNSPTFSIQVDALPVVEDGEYPVTITYYSAQDLFDTSKFYAPLTHSLALTRGTGVATYTRNSTATVMGYAPTANPGDAQVVLNCAVNEARFQGARRISEGVWSNTYANGTPISSDDLLGYLSEGARTNLAIYSEQFDNSIWVKVSTTISANATTSPDGALTADKFISSSAATNHFFYSSPQSTAGLLTFTMFAKSGEYNFLALGSNNPAEVYSYFDLSTGQVSSVPAQHTSNIVNVGNGWFRCSITFTTTADNVAIIAGVSNASGSIGIAGDDTSGIYIWGAQLEQAAFASSYIPTTTSAVTRAEDVLSYPKAGNLLNAAGTAYAECGKVFDNFSRVIGDGGNSAVTVLASFPVGASQIYDGTNSVINEFTNLDTNKIASKWSGSSMATTGNGDTVDSTAYIGSLNLPNGIGIGTGGDIPPYSPIREVYIWDIALEDYQLSYITTTELHQ